MIAATDVTGIILCGGHSSRMGFNKALLKLDGQYVILQTAAKLKELFPAVVLMTNNQQNFRVSDAFAGYPIWEDDYQNSGPLGGLVTALARVTTPYIFVTACDIPNISLTMIRQLLNGVQSEQVILYQQDNRIESLFGLYHRSCLPLFTAQLAQGNGQIRYYFPQLRVRLLSSPLTELRNINTPADLPGWRIKK
ncbi:molybdenum cofactor guanylyltransferase [Loigolactobacillus coryniformis]|uniref:molybdenum cofactor guanylyltransferase n=1 Tax=Loigolactobacillus coryniformis TaxID=1610 RepID=UPI00345DD9A4